MILILEPDALMDRLLLFTTLKVKLAIKLSFIFKGEAYVKEQRYLKLLKVVMKEVLLFSEVLKIIQNNSSLISTHFYHQIQLQILFTITGIKRYSLIVMELFIRVLYLSPMSIMDQIFILEVLIILKHILNFSIRNLICIVQNKLLCREVQQEEFLFLFGVITCIISYKPKIYY